MSQDEELTQTSKERQSTRMEEVSGELRREILTGTLGPGYKLREVQLAESYGVSRSTFREAIQQLVHEGLLVREKYKGVRVAKIDRKTVEDLSIVRINLETLAACTIAKDPTGESQKILQNALTDYLESGRAGDPVVEQEMHMALHKAIWFATDNEVIHRVWASLESLINLSTATDFAARHGDINRQRERHQKLVEQILAGDDTMISSVVEDHILDNVLLFRLRGDFSSSQLPYLNIT